MEGMGKRLLLEAHRPHWASTRVWFGFAAAYLTAQGLLLWAWAGGVWWLACLLVLVVAHLSHAHLIAFHEAAHGTLCPNRPTNEALGVFIGLLSFMSLALYRAVHHTHHAYLGQERDEE